MSHTNPFLEDDLIASIARDTESVQKKQSEDLQAFLKTQNPQSKAQPAFAQNSTPVIQSKAKNPSRFPVILNSKPVIPGLIGNLKNLINNFNPIQSMSYNFTHLTKFSIAGLALFTILAGGLSAQAFAPDEYKPLTLLQQKTLKDFGGIKNQTSTQVADNTNISKNLVSVDFCNALKISHFEIKGAGSTGGFNYGWSLGDPNRNPNSNSKIDFYLNQFEIQCQNSETQNAFGNDYVPTLDKASLEAEKCNNSNKVCLTSYTIEKLSREKLPFLTTRLKESIKDDAQVVERTYSQYGSKSEDKTYIFNDNKGNNYHLSVKNGEVFSDTYNLQIDLK